MLPRVYTFALMRFRGFRRSQVTVMLLLVAQAFVTGCDDQGGSAPIATGPTAPTPSPAALAGEPIRGTASDSAFRPLAGARVEILDGPQAGMSTTSDARGDFSFMATVDDDHTVPGKQGRSRHIDCDNPAGMRSL